MRSVRVLGFNVAAVLSAVLSVALLWVYASAKDVSLFHWDAGPSGRWVSVIYAVEERNGMFQLSRVCRVSWFSLIGQQTRLEVVGRIDLLGFGYSDDGAASGKKFYGIWIWNVIMAMALAMVPGLWLAHRVPRRSIP